MDFDYLADSKVKAGGLTYQDLATEYPKIKIRFDSYILPVILVETEDNDLIEEMFSRLNEAVPLNAAEKEMHLVVQWQKVLEILQQMNSLQTELDLEMAGISIEK